MYVFVNHARQNVPTLGQIVEKPRIFTPKPTITTNHKFLDERSPGNRANIPMRFIFNFIRRRSIQQQKKNR